MLIWPARLRFFALATSCVLALLGATGAGADETGQGAGENFAGVTPKPAGPIHMHGAVRYIAPAGWTVSDGADGVTTLTGRVAQNDLPCEIWMLPPIPAQGDLATEGMALVAGLAATKQFGPYHGELGKAVMDSREEGVSGTGWSFADLSGEAGNSGITIRVLMARLNDGKVLPIIGYSKTWDCLGNQAVRDNDVWALFFHSLQLPGYDRPTPELGKQIVGEWTSIGGGAGVTEIFAPNGHFANVAVYQTYVANTSGLVWAVNRAWKGDGPYEVHGDRVHTQNPKGSATEKDVTRLFSVVRMPNPSKPTGYDWVLRMVERSSDGSQTWGFSHSGNYVLHMVRHEQPQ
jgi:hypothetical protein